MASTFLKKKSWETRTKKPRLTTQLATPDGMFIWRLAEEETHLGCKGCHKKHCGEETGGPTSCCSWAEAQPVFPLPATFGSIWFEGIGTALRRQQWHFLCAACHIDLASRNVGLISIGSAADSFYPAVFKPTSPFT